MSTIDRERNITVPPLVDGQRLDRATFHERYEAMPPETRAELIGGVVVMSSPVGPGHGFFVYRLTGWLNNYQRGLPGLVGGCDSTTMLDDQSEPQPDIHLRILSGYGGQTSVEPGYISGAPELVVEVSHTSKKIDLGPKLEDYRRTGVLEYLVVTLDPDEVHWFARRGDRFVPMTPGPDGAFRSEIFPGLWLDPLALFDDDLDGLFAVVERGRAMPEHAEFVARLNARRPQPTGEEAER
jgi:Uma2 family endonuclease